MKKVKKIINGNIFWKYNGRLYPDYLAHGNAQAFISEIALKYCVGNGLDIGAGINVLPGATPVGQWPLLNMGAHKLPHSNCGNQTLDYIFSSHCLEHLKAPGEALDLWISKIKTDGILFLYLPHPDMEMWRQGEEHGQKHEWIPTPAILEKMFRERNLQVLEIQYTEDIYYSFHIVGRKLKETQNV